MSFPSTRRRRSRARFVRTLAGLAVVLCALPPVAFVGFGLARGYDVVAGLGGLLHEPTGTTVPSSEVPLQTPLRVEWQGPLEAFDLAEASGLAVSRRRPDLLWAHNDSGNPLDVYALDTRGRALGSVRVEGTTADDWEDMAAFELDGRSYLLIGDVGDNYGWRRTLTLHVIEEPEVPPQGLPAGARAELAWTIRFAYPDGPRDCEALAVDPDAADVLLLSKRTIPAEVYRVPLRPASTSTEIRIAERIATLDGLPQPDERTRLEDPDLGQYRSQPTALDVAGSLAAVVTYGDAYLYARPPGGTWADAFRQLPARLALPFAPQREAAALSPDGRFLFATSERGRRGEASLFRVTLADAPAE